MKKTISIALVLLTVVFIFASCSSSNKITDEKIIGTWEFVQGEIYNFQNGSGIRVDFLKGGTAIEYYDSPDFSDGFTSEFRWEINENDNEVMNTLTPKPGLGVGDDITGFTLVNNDGVLELHSVDGSIILKKIS